MNERTPLLILGLGNVLLEDDGVGSAAVRALPRVGVAYAAEAAAWPLRFALDLAAPAPRSSWQSHEL